MRYILLLIIVLNSADLNSQTPGKDNLPNRLNEYFTALTNIKSFNGNVLVSKNGQVLLDQTYNIQNEIEDLHVTKDSKFIIASVSKIFIRYAILKLVDDGKLELSKKINLYIPDFPSGNKITIEQLMFHTSGLPREIKDYDKYENLSLEKVAELAKKESLQFEPGTQTLYSNVGYFILHYIIDKLSGSGYLKYMNKEIIQKYKLQNTGEFNNSHSITNFAYGFTNENNAITPISQSSINRFETGNYYSTTTDLYHFSEQLLNGKFIKKELAQKMFGKEHLLVQAGGRPGYRAYYYQNLTTGITFLFLTNYSDIPFQEVTTDIINLLEGKPYEIPKKIHRKVIKLSDEILERYTGKYALEADPTQIFTVLLENNQLYISDKHGEKVAVYPESETSFFDNPESRDGYDFVKAEGNLYTMTITSTGVKFSAKKIKSLH
ncbi:hypothetical protein GCM10009120_51070 [Sphingobacterium siyangense subsp. cladoniae]|uniref:serine hydrolase domain-containing protein n=1 Tax=Sphingobacterium siyangense TaxID=459529 RepID=UPI0031F89F82